MDPIHFNSMWFCKNCQAKMAAAMPYFGGPGHIAPPTCDMACSGLVYRARRSADSGASSSGAEPAEAGKRQD